MVLAGGRSSRFGRDKLAEPYRGRPLLHHSVNAVAAACGDVVVVLAPDAEPPGLPDVGIPVRTARDLEPYAGPLAGLAAGLAGCRTPLALVVGGDMPEPSPAVLAELVRTIDEEGAGAAALAEGQGIRPLPCAVRTGCLPVAERLLSRGERRLGALLEALDVRAVPEARWRALDPSAASLRDIDRPEDLEDGR